MKLMGIDQSLTSTAFVILENNNIINEHIISTKPEDGDIIERAMIIANVIVNSVLTTKPDLIAIEEPIHAKNANITIKLSILYGVIIAKLKDVEINSAISSYKPKIVPINVSELKLKTTGKGNASKDDMKLSIHPSIIESWELKYKKIDDLVDAYSLAKLLEDNENF